MGEGVGYYEKKEIGILAREKISQRGSYRGIFMIRDSLILLSVKHEFNKLFFVIREPKDFRDQ